MPQTSTDAEAKRPTSEQAKPSTTAEAEPFRRGQALLQRSYDKALDSHSHRRQKRALQALPDAGIDLVRCDRGLRNYCRSTQAVV